MKDNTESTFSRVVQIGIVVKDVEQTVKRLEALGIGPFTEISLPPGGEEWFHDKPMHADFKFRSVMIGDLQIELIQPVSGDSPHKEFLETRGEGIHHIAFSVRDVQKEVIGLRDQGVEVVLRARFPAGGEWLT